MCLLPQSSNAQFTDYERDTKWNLGFNMGGVWQDGDIRLDRPGFGYGFTLGKGIYEHPSRFWSVDLRFRYLKGFTYGLNTFRTDSSEIEDNTVLSTNPTNYKNMLGYTYLNSKTMIHDFSLEAVLNFHALREKTGILLSVFGGVGVTDYRTWTNLTNDSNNFYEIYNYNDLDEKTVTKQELRGFLDDDTRDYNGYETYAPYNEEVTVKFMPSLGIGLGYQFTKQLSLGFEHRVTFALQDKFDGQVKEGTQFLQWGDNDKYHYSSVFLRWNIFRGEESSSTSSRNCPPPYLKIADYPEVYEVNENTLAVRARVSKIKSNNDVILVVNEQIEQTVYNKNTDYVSGTINLLEGENKVYFIATNACGETMDSLLVIYNPDFCPKPVITFAESVKDSVSSKDITVKATLLRLQGGSLQVTLNNKVVPHQFDSVNRILSSSMSLNLGVNTISIKGVNKCGDTTVTKQITYYCIPPKVTISSPKNGSLYKNPTINLEALTTNVVDKSQVSVTFNGQNTAFNYSTTSGKVTGSLRLVEGTNILSVRVNNDCGTDTKTVTFNYEEPCLLPVVTISSPTNNSNVSTPTLNFRGAVTNITTGSSVVLKVNGVRVNANYNGSNGSVSAVLNLRQGTNTIELSGTNNCGNDNEVVRVTYNCPAPSIVITSPGNGATVTSQNITVSGRVTNVTSSNQVNLLINGVSTPVNVSGGNFSANVNLRGGQNTITASVSTNCGNDSKTVVVNYSKPCPKPYVSITSPANGSNVSASTVTLTGTAVNINSQSDMSVKLNGVNQSFSWNSSNKVYVASLNLRQGSNTILVSAATNCGNDAKTITLNYSKACPKPTVTITSPRNGLNANSLSVPFTGVVTNIQNASQVTLKLNGRVVNKSFNASTGLVSATLPIINGGNTIELIATNNCGTANSSVSVSYRCPLPTVNIASPNSGMSYTTSSVNFNGFVSGVSTKSQISVTLNGSAISFNYDARLSKFSGTANLSQGSNTLAATVTNQCGTVKKSVSVTYTKPCPKPTVVITSPSNGSTVSSSTVQISGVAANLNSQSDLQLRVNGVSTNFSYNSSNKLFSASVNLKEGVNTIVASVSTNCGNDAKTVNVTYKKPCPKPTVTILNPKNGATPVDQYILINGTSNNVTAKSQMTLKINGVSIPFTFNTATGAWTSNYDLSAGSNVITVTVSTPCGTDTKSVTIGWSAPCPKPVVALNTPSNGSVFSKTSTSISGTVTNVSNKSDIKVMVNGVSVPFSFNTTSKSFSATANLKEGVNNISVIANTNCGGNTKNITVTYKKPCSTPSVTLSAPTNGSTTTSGLVTIKGIATNIKSSSELTVTVNGTKVNASYSTTSKVYSASAPLREGKNTIVASVSNACGNASKAANITYNKPCPKPVVTIISPKNNASISSSKATVSGTVANITNKADMQIRVNGSLVAFTYNSSTKAFSASVNINAGAPNTIVVEAATNCGNDSKSISVSSVVKIKPIIIVANPSASSTNSTAAQFKVFGTVERVSSKSQFTIKVNGTSYTGFTFTNTGTQKFAFNGLINIQPGTNTVVFTAVHATGGVETITKTIVVTSNVKSSPNTKEKGTPDTEQGGTTPQRSPRRR